MVQTLCIMFAYPYSLLYHKFDPFLWHITITIISYLYLTKIFTTKLFQHWVKFSKGDKSFFSNTQHMTWIYRSSGKKKQSEPLHTCNKSRIEICKIRQIFKGDLIKFLRFLQKSLWSAPKIIKNYAYVSEVQSTYRQYMYWDRKSV